MEPAIGVALFSSLFIGTHVGLATAGIRARLVASLGENGFRALYSLVATLMFALLVSYYAAHRGEGMAGIDAGAVPLVHALLVAAIVAGVALAVAGLASYPRLPVALFGHEVREPYGVERITRHPFFAGTAMIGIAHVLLAPRLAGAVLMGALALLAIVGARHQETKYLQRRGPAYARYLAVTSMVPFAAIVSGRQRLVWQELPFGAFAAGLAIAWLLRFVHPSLFAGGGRWIVLAAVAGGGIASVQSWLHVRRVGRRVSPEAVRG